MGDPRSSEEFRGGCFFSSFSVVLLIQIVLAGDPPIPPHEFTGNVTLVGDPAPDGTEVRVKAFDEVLGKLVPIELPPYSVDAEGRHLTVNGTYGALQVFQVPADIPNTSEREGAKESESLFFFVVTNGAELPARMFDADGNEIPLGEGFLFAPGVTVLNLVGAIGVTKTEDTDGTCTPADCSLREAIKAADSGDTIIIPAGTYTLTLGTELVIDKSLSLTGDGPDLTIIQAGTDVGDATARVMTVSDGPVSISGVTIRHGNTTGDGGGIWNKGTLSVASSQLTANTAANDGGGIRNDGSLVLVDSTVSVNTAGFAGDGILNSGTLAITGSTVGGNNAGGIFNTRFGTLTITNGTISNNHNTLRGGGIENRGELTLINSTVAGNTSGIEGGGINLEFGGTADLVNTIIANNPTGGDCALDDFTSLGHNLDSDGTCNLTEATDLPNADPLLGPLQHNGGPTLTHALLPGSPAIDAGEDAAAPATDQRGVPRPQGARSDIGAYERGPDCAGRASTIVGTSAGETIVGTPGDDVIVAKGGADVIRALGGNDVVCAGPGNDRVLGGKGRDQLLGGGGKDTLKGQGGTDGLFGQGGGDRLIGGGGKDVLNGGGGNDTLLGNRGDDRLLGKAGNDELDCGPGNDIGRGGRTDTAVGCETVSGVEPETLGRVTIMDSDNDDFSDMLSDAAVIQLELPLLGPDEIYEGWLVSDDDSRKQSMGILLQDGNGAVDQTYTSPVGENLFAEFGHFVVTVEPVPDADPGPSDDVVALHQIPAGGLMHIRHLVFSWAGNPAYPTGFHAGTPKGIVVGLRDQLGVALVHVNLALESTTLANVHLHTCHVVNTLEGTDGPNFDPTCGNPGDGFGVLTYAADTQEHARLAAQAAPRDPVIVSKATAVIDVASLVEEGSQRARDSALDALASNDLLTVVLALRNARNDLSFAADSAVSRVYWAAQLMGTYVLEPPD